MSGILILSSPQDLHSRCVSWALSKIGVDFTLIHYNDFPDMARHTASFDDGRMKYGIVDPSGQAIDFMSYPVVWNHRGVGPVIGSDLDSRDREAAELEAQTFLEGVKSVCAATQQWFNPPDVERRAGSKPYQLWLAQNCGLAIPNTVITNDPIKAKAFVQSCPNGAVYKTMYPISWHDENNVYMMYTSRVSEVADLDMSPVRFTAHLFQTLVKRAFELRVYYFDGEIRAFRLDVGAADIGSIDWRAGQSTSLAVERYDGLDSETLAALRKYSELAGLRYGAFDMIVDEYGRTVFLECNPSGQFLFIERLCPEAGVLSSFVEMITKSVLARDHPNLQDIRLSSFEEEEEDRYALSTAHSAQGMRPFHYSDCTSIDA